MFGYMFLRSRLGGAEENRIPKVLVKHQANEAPPFVDATGTLSGSLLEMYDTTRSRAVGWKPLLMTE